MPDAADDTALDVLADTPVESDPVVAPDAVPEPEPQPFPLLDLSLPVSSKLDAIVYPVVRVLTLPEIKQYVEPIFTSNGALLPQWTSSFFVGAVDEAGTVLGWITVQSVIHTEPMYVEHGQSALLPRIISGAQHEIERVIGQCRIYLTASDERVVKLAQRIGMVSESGTVLTKWVGPVPVAPVVSVPVEDIKEAA